MLIKRYKFENNNNELIKELIKYKNDNSYKYQEIILIISEGKTISNYINF